MNKKVKQTGCHFLHLLCGPLDEETVFEKWGEEADGAVDKKMIEQPHFVTRCSINILSVTKYFEEIEIGRAHV